MHACCVTAFVRKPLELGQESMCGQNPYALFAITDSFSVGFHIVFIIGCAQVTGTFHLIASESLVVTIDEPRMCNQTALAV